MITEREYTVFKPIKLTISTQEELDHFKEAIEHLIDGSELDKELLEFVEELNTNISCYE